MQRGHLEAVLPVLAANGRTPTVAFLGNNASGPGELVDALGAQRVLMGFPGFGGYLDGPVVHFAAEGDADAALVLTLGELDGRRSPRIDAIVSAFAEADVRVEVEPRIDAWLKSHVALVLPFVQGLQRHGLDNEALARDKETLRAMARAVREGLRALRRLGYVVTPFRLRSICWLPTAVTAAILGKIAGSDFARVAFAGHAAVAADEFELLAAELRSLVAQAGVSTPALDALCEDRGRLGLAETH
jgi:2-dehydropantoate 2-reductase